MKELQVFIVVIFVVVVTGEQTDAKTKQIFSNGVYYGLYGRTIIITCPPTLPNMLPENHLRSMPLFGFMTALAPMRHLYYCKGQNEF